MKPRLMSLGLAFVSACSVSAAQGPSETRRYDLSCAATTTESSIEAMIVTENWR